MKRALKTGCVLILAVAMLAGLFACDGREEVLTTVPPTYEPKVTGEVKFTCNISKLVDEQAADAFIEAFENYYEGTEVDPDYTPGDIPARISSGDIGDVFWFTETECYNYAVTQKSLLPLNQYIEPLKVDTSNVYSGIFALGEVDGQLYMVPRDYNHIVLVYNKTALREAGLEDPKSGWTWDEFKEYCTKLTKTDPNDPTQYIQVGADLNYAWAPVYSSFLEGWGGTWVDTKEKSVNLTDDLVRQGIGELLDLAKTGVIKPEGGDMSAYSSLEDEDYVFRTMVYPSITSVGQRYDALGLEWDFADFPALPTHAVGTGATGFGVYKYSDNLDTAAALALFFLTEEGQRAYHSTDGGSVPLLTSLEGEGFWRYADTADTETDWSQKNYDAFVSFPEADIVGQPNCRMPSQVATVIMNGWEGMLKAFFESGNYIDSLTAMEKQANERWDKIIAANQ